MDPSKNYPTHSYNFPNQPQNFNPENPNMQAPENTQSGGMQPNIQNPYMMHPNFQMQYINPYLPYGYHPSQGSNYAPPQGSNYAPPQGSNYAPPLGSNYAPPLTNFPTPVSIEPPTLHFSSGSTEIPEFSTQISLGDIGEDTPDTFLHPTHQPKKKSNYASWSTEDNILLLTAYFQASNDSELGNNQKGETFWGKITQNVNENGGKERTTARCQSHHKDLNKKISNFVGCYSTVCRQRQSGWGDDDYINRARELYFEKVGTRFNLVAEWKVVRDQPKYMSSVASAGSSGSKRKSSSEDVESPAPTFVRPEGREAAKKKSRGSSSKSRKSKQELQDELSDIAMMRAQAEEKRASAVEAMNVLARAKNLETWRYLKSLPERDEEDEEALEQLRKELFGSK
ncbi:hypothetical protein CASFOL_002310 [Castilleja foliolosa]|uniref:Myb-like domain-containing protein n=1 Tax=Castilleja foliolosa TaxID=1961234 RepID=A0ABD3EHH4_9LAMI